MKSLAYCITLIATSWLLSTSVAPWWICAVVAFLLAYMLGESAWRAFLLSFVSIALLWMILAWYTDISNDGYLSSQIAELFQLNSSILLILLPAIVAGLISGLAASSASLLKTKKTS